MLNNLLIDFIVDDIDNTCFSTGMSCLEKHKIKNEVRLRYGLFKNGKSVFKQKATDVFYQKSYDVKSYIYYIIEAFLTINEDLFNYSAYEYCEKRIVRRDTEQWFMFYVLSQIMKKENKPSKSVLCCILRSLLLIPYPSETVIDLDRMISYIEIARKECLIFHNSPTRINNICDMYISELKESFYKMASSLY